MLLRYKLLHRFFNAFNLRNLIGFMAVEFRKTITILYIKIINKYFCKATMKNNNSN